MNTSKLKDMLSATFQPALKEGVYPVKLLKYDLVENEKGDYVKFTFEVLDDTHRQLTENRFEKGFGVMVSHLRQQLGREDEAIQPNIFFNELIEKKTQFNIWITKAEVNGAQRTNFNFIKPLPKPVVNIKVETTTTNSDDVEVE